MRCHQSHLNILTLSFLLICAIPACTTQAEPASSSDNSNELTAAAAATLAQQLIDEWKDSVNLALDNAFRNRALEIGNYRMKFHYNIYKEADFNDADGLALYISLHGGGGTTAAENDSQWRNQQLLYRPRNAVYLSPRAIQDSWDMHFRPECDEFYSELIQLCIARLNVNPDKVYIMGYSAGGDGVWRLAPRMADHWAAAAMMAGHPGDVSLVNLRNTPFAIWCGELDDAYDRNTRCAERIEEMRQLHESDPDGYIYDGHIVAGMGHWMEQQDTAAVTWMAQYQRNPYPQHIVWQQEEVTEPYFYWLGIQSEEQQRGMEVRANISDNTITLTHCDYTTLTIYLNDDMVDLDRPVKVVSNGTTLFEGLLKRSSQMMRETLFTRNDPRYIFSAKIQVTTADK